MANQGNSASYWFEKDASETPPAAADGGETVKRRIPSPLNLFARRLRQREEIHEIPADAPDPVEPITDVVQRLARERAEAEARTAPDAAPDSAAETVAHVAQMLAVDDPSADNAAVIEAVAAGLPVADAPAAEASDITPAAIAPQPVFAADPVPAQAAPAPMAAVQQTPVVEPAPQAEAPVQQPMVSERVVLDPTPVQPAPAAEGEVPARRTSRVKTTFLGFERSDGRIEDIFQKEEKPAEAGPVNVMFPVGWLVIVEGEGRGNAIALRAGVSQIGRGEDQAVQLNFGDMSVSRQNHAAIAFDHEDRRFYLGHGGKANIVRLNGRPVLSTETLEHGDKIKIGETTMQFVALCGPDFHWT